MSDEKTKSTPSNTQKDHENNFVQVIIKKVEEMVTKMDEFLKSHHPIDDGSSSLQSQLERLHKNLKQIKEALTKLKKFEEGQIRASLEQLTAHLSSLGAFLNGENKTADSTKNQATKLQEINKKLKKLQFHIPSVSKLASSEGSSAHDNLKAISGSNASSEAHKLLNPHQSDQSQTEFQKSPFYKEIEVIFRSLDEKKKFCLTCFSVFPENEVVKRRILTYWLIGEGFVKASGNEEKEVGSTGKNKPDTPEKIVDEILVELKEKGLIEPAKGKRGRHTKSYRMHPLVRSAVIMLSQHQRKCDPKGNLTASLSGSGMAFLMKAEEGSLKQESESTKNTDHQQESSTTTTKNADDVKYQTLFNVNEPFPEANLGELAKNSNVAEWSLKLKHVKVLYLGRWQKSDNKHIEVESSDFLKGLKNTGDLTLLSLQWISRIAELPRSIASLPNLLILDLKACHNLVELPKEITSLKELIYMDVSECYLLEHMPKKLSSLSKLQVLKGFVIGNRLNRSWGTLDDLKGLTKLRKLTINASSDEFPTEKDLIALNSLRALRKLTIAWGARQGNNGDAKPEEPAKVEKVEKLCCQKLIIRWAAKQGNDEAKPEGLENLEKLDLLCFPKSQPPIWLDPGKLKNVKKLYIRGGRLQTLGKHEWSKVNTLCLKFLSEFKMNWIQLQEKFRKLNYLEKVRCPRITFCPCDENGVWLKNE